MRSFPGSHFLCWVGPVRCSADGAGLSDVQRCFFPTITANFFCRSMVGWDCGQRFFVFLMAIFETTNLIRFFTRFTDEIFAALISLIFISEAVKNLFGFLQSAWDEEDLIHHDQAFLSLMLALGTFIVAMNLSRFRKSRYLRPKMREFLSDFGPSIAVISMTVLAFSFTDISSPNPAVELEALTVPDTFGPTLEGRSWLVNLWVVPRWAILRQRYPDCWFRFSCISIKTLPSDW